MRGAVLVDDIWKASMVAHIQYIDHEVEYLLVQQDLVEPDYYWISQRAT